MVAAAFLVQADFSGTAFGGTPTWTDITGFVLTVDEAPIVINWGRQDEQSEPQPRTCSMTLDNSDGRFTPGLTSGPYGTAIDVGVRIRVSTTANAVTTVRFDGYANDWDAGWDNGGPMSVCTLEASDIFAQMGTLQPLRALVVEEMILDAPSALYLLDEAAGAVSFGDATGITAAAVATASKYGAGKISAGTDAGAAVALPGTATTFANGTTLTGLQSVIALPSSAQSGSTPLTYECWIRTTATTIAGHFAALFAAYNNALAIQFQMAVDLASNEINFGGPGFSPVTQLNDGNWHHLAGVDSGASRTVYVDGVACSFVGASSLFTRVLSGVWLGGQLNYVTAFYPYSGDMAAAAIYPTGLSATRVLAHYNAGKTAFAGERTDLHAARLLSYRPNTGSALDVGRGAVGAHDTAGVTLQQALQDTAAAEGGPVFADGQGRVTLYNRARQYDPAVGLGVDASLDQVTADLRFRRDTQDIVNDATVSRPGGASQRSVNATSVNKYGTKAITPTLIINSDRDADDAAGWAVAAGKAVKTKSPQLTVNLLTEPSASQAAAVLAAGPSTVVSFINLPAATSPATSMKAVIQGGVETIGVDAWDISFYATALPPGTLRADAAPSANTKLDSGLVIPR